LDKGKRHSGDLLVDLLADNGVSHVFGVPGGQSMPLYDALHSGRRPVRHIIMRDERNLPYAALAYARVTGKAGVLDATVGPGAALLPLGLAEAYHSATPVVALISELPVNWMPMAEWGSASQGMDQLGLLAKVTKWQGTVRAQEQIPTLVRHAFLKAVTGRPGPTVLTIPEDIYLQETTPEAEAAVRPPVGSSFPTYRILPESEAIQAAAALLLSAQRPVIVAGGGALLSGAEEAILRLAEHLQIPVATTLMGKGAIAESHPLAIGVLGPIGMKCAEEVARDADVVFLVGFKNAQNSTFGWTFPAPHQQVIHLDVDPEQIGRFFPTAVGLVGDARAALTALFEAVQARTGPVERTDWRNRVSAAREDWTRAVAGEITSAEIPIKPQRVVAEIAAAAGPEDIVVCDASFASGWGAVYYPVRQAGRRVILPRGMAGLGFGLPAALGAAVACPDRNVFCLAGDGGFAYSLGELATLRAYGIKVISVVLNNASWGWMEWINKLNWDKEYFDLPVLDFARVAEGLGCRGVTITHPDQLAPVLQEAVRGEESVVINVRTAVWETPVMPFREAMARRQKAGYMGTPVRAGDDFTRVLP